jgi:hypothetical protein
LGKRLIVSSAETEPDSPESDHHKEPPAKGPPAMSPAAK